MTPAPTSRRRLLAAVALPTAACLGIAAWTAPASAVRFAPGSTSGGDPYFPASGNGGYQVEHYDPDISYDPVPKAIRSTAEITLQATADIDSFSLDLRDFTVDSVRIGLLMAPFTHVDGGSSSSVPGPRSRAARRGP